MSISFLVLYYHIRSGNIFTETALIQLNYVFGVCVAIVCYSFSLPYYTLWFMFNFNNINGEERIQTIVDAVMGPFTNYARCTGSVVRFLHFYHFLHSFWRSRGRGAKFVIFVECAVCESSHYSSWYLQLELCLLFCPTWFCQLSTS